MALLRSRIALGAGLALAVGITALLLLRPGPEGAERVKAMVDWDGTCVDVELHRDPRYLPEYARGWRSASERASMFCTELGDSLVYARFPDGRSLNAALTASPPLRRFCFQPAGLESFDHDAVGGAAAFRARCARARGELDEGTERHCVAGAEVAVDGLDEPRDFDALCDDMGGELRRAPRAVLER